MMNNPDKPNYRTMFELFYVDDGSLLHKKLPLKYFIGDKYGE